MVYKIETLIFNNGERYPVLIDEKGVPHFYVTLYVTVKLRSSQAANSIRNRLKSIQRCLSWEKENKRCLFSEFEKRAFLSDEDIASLRAYLRINVATLKKREEKEQNRKRKKIFNLSDGEVATVRAIESVSSTHHYNRMTSVAEYLHFLARVVNQHHNNAAVIKQIDKMLADFKKVRPKGISKNRASNIESTSLSQELLERFMDVANPDHALNPFKSSTIRKRNHLMFALLRELGIRRGEMLSLQISMMDLTGDKPSIWVKRHHDDIYDTRKNQPVAKTRERLLPLKPYLAELLNDYIINDRALIPEARKHPYLFVVHRNSKTRGQPISLHTFDSEIIRKMKEVDRTFNVIHAHTFRHAWNEKLSLSIDEHNKKSATDKLDGKPAKEPITPEREAKIRKHLMGHSSEKSGEVYNSRHIKEKANELMLDEQMLLNEKINDAKNKGGGK
jgi:integrase